MWHIKLRMSRSFPVLDRVVSKFVTLLVSQPHHRYVFRSQFGSTSSPIRATRYEWPLFSVGRINLGHFYGRANYRYFLSLVVCGPVSPV